MQALGSTVLTNLGAPNPGAPKKPWSKLRVESGRAGRAHDWGEVEPPPQIWQPGGRPNEDQRRPPAARTPRSRSRPPASPPSSGRLRGESSSRPRRWKRHSGGVLPRRAAPHPEAVRSERAPDPHPVGALREPVHVLRPPRHGCERGTNARSVGASGAGPGSGARSATRERALRRPNVKTWGAAATTRCAPSSADAAGRS